LPTNCCSRSRLHVHGRDPGSDGTRRRAMLDARASCSGTIAADPRLSPSSLSVSSPGHHTGTVGASDRDGPLISMRCDDPPCFTDNIALHHRTYWRPQAPNQPDGGRGGGPFTPGLVLIVWPTARKSVGDMYLGAWGPSVIPDRAVTGYTVLSASSGPEQRAAGVCRATPTDAAGLAMWKKCLSFSSRPAVLTSLDARAPEAGSGHPTRPARGRGRRMCWRPCTTSEFSGTATGSDRRSDRRGIAHDRDFY